MKIIGLALTSVLLASCATASGPAYNASIASGDKVVVYRPAEFGVPRAAKITVDGQFKCDMPAKSFVIVQTGHIEANIWDMGTSDITVNGFGVHYVRVAYDRGASSGAAFGAIGAVISSGMAGGPFDILEVSKDQAESELAELKQGC